MTKVAFIVPYTEKRDWVQFIDLILEDINCPSNVSFEILCTEGRIESLLADWEGDLVIARGLAYSVLKQRNYPFHLIECPLANIEILRAVQSAANQLGAYRVALFIGKNASIEIPFCESLCRVKLDVFEVENDDEAAAQFRMMEEHGGCDAVVGGYTVCRMATDKGFSAIPLRMGEEAVRTAIHEALSVIEGSRREKQRNELLNCMIEMMEEGIVALDSQGTILKINQICMEMLHLRRKNVVGLPAKDCIPETVLDVREDNSIIKLSSRNVLVRRNPIVIDGETEGTVIMLQYVEALQKAEIAVRQKLNEKGLVAKYYFQDIIGSSAPLQKAVEQAKRFAKTDSDIRKSGETS